MECGQARRGTAVRAGRSCRGARFAREQGETAAVCACTGQEAAGKQAARVARGRATGGERLARERGRRPGHGLLRNARARGGMRGRVRGPGGQWRVRPALIAVGGRAMRRWRGKRERGRGTTGEKGKVTSMNGIGNRESGVRDR